MLLRPPGLDRDLLSPLVNFPDSGEARVEIYSGPLKTSLLYSTGNSAQYSVITFMRRESEKEWIYV